MSTQKADWGYGAASGDALQAYERTLVGPIFTPWAEVLLDELHLQPGQALLDVATGPGTVARVASARLGPHGRVTACDLSASMLAIARQKPAVPNGAPIDFRECSAASLTVASDAYDIVTCQQGVQFFPDRPTALAEFGRALKPGGSVGVAVWSGIDRCPPFALVAEAIAAVMGDLVADRYRSGPWGLSSAGEVADLVAGARFEEVRVKEMRLPLLLDHGAAQLVASLPASAIAADFEALDSRQRRALDTKAAELMAPLTIDGRIQSEMASSIVVARKPA